jgi:hypothetical protein
VASIQNGNVRMSGGLHGLIACLAEGPIVMVAWMLFLDYMYPGSYFAFGSVARTLAHSWRGQMGVGRCGKFCGVR